MRSGGWNGLSHKNMVQSGYIHPISSHIRTLFGRRAYLHKNQQDRCNATKDTKCLQLWSDRGTYTLYLPTYEFYFVLRLMSKNEQGMCNATKDIQNFTNYGPFGVHTPYIVFHRSISSQAHDLD